MKHPFSLGTPALRLLLGGHVLIVVALCDFAARLHGGASLEVLLYIGEFIRSVAISYVILWGAGLGLDYWDSINNLN